MRQQFIYTLCFFTLFLGACSDSTSQRDNSGAEKESNWLPTKKGPFMLTIRLYIPEDTGYQPPALFKFN